MLDNDLTLLFVHAGQLPEKWVAFHKEQLDKLPYPIIDLYDEEKLGYEMIYKRMLEGAKQTTTPFVAIIEDDVLYPIEHFYFRPELDTFAYNQNRWALFTFGVPTYNWRNRKSNCTLIAPRELMIEALEERFAKFPNGIPKEWCGELGRANIDKWLGVTPRKSIEWYSKVSVIQINHDSGTEERVQRHRKELGPMRAYDFPVWGRAENLILKYI